MKKCIFLIIFHISIVQVYATDNYSIPNVFRAGQTISSSEIIRDVRARTYLTDDGQAQSSAGRVSEVKQVPNPTNVSPETSPLNITETINFFDGNDSDYNTDKTTIT